MGEIKLICQSSLTAFFFFFLSTKLTLGNKTWLGRPAAFTVGMFVCGNSALKNLWSDS